MSPEIAEPSVLIDQYQRDLFCNEIHKNFSVIAPAGVGKTTAIVARIVRFLDYAATYDPSLASSLVIVTYTQKAANEMYQRTRQKLLQSNASPKTLELADHAFFGTIHSFCFQLIKSYGFLLGLPSNLTIKTNTNTLWNEFCRHSEPLNAFLASPFVASLQKYLPLDKLLALARNLSPDITAEDPSSSSPPEVDTLPIYEFAKESKNKFLWEYMDQLEGWLKLQSGDHLAIDLPLDVKGGKAFSEIVNDGFFPLWNWLNQATLFVAKTIAQLYLDYRLIKQVVTYDDIIHLAHKLSQTPDAQVHLQEKTYRILLDEAQDTDPKQFEILLSAAATNERNQPQAGAFSMVGDPQQAIYSSRADLPTYLRVHQELIQHETAEELTFHVTMRCDKAIVAHVNQVFPSVLSEHRTHQVQFVTINARPWCGPGAVQKWSLIPPASDKLSDPEAMALEAEAIAERLAACQPSGLGVTHWHNVAFLAPRKSWLEPIAAALEAQGIPAQLHSTSHTNASNPAYIWATALLAVVCNPYDGFELAGVLREIFGISDHDITVFCKENTLQIATPTLLDSPLAQALSQLHRVFLSSRNSPLGQWLINTVDALNLRLKLTSLDQHDPQTALSMLDSLIAKAAYAETEAIDIFAFLKELRDSLTLSESNVTAKENHVQLFTCHKSKGLEWPVVIVPYLYKDIRFPYQSYPQIFDLPIDGYPQVAICSHPEKEVYSKELDNYRQAELERLLYVTATRASRSLIFIDDQEYFPKSKVSIASLLKFKFNQTNNALWQGLPEVHPTSAETLQPEVINKKPSSTRSQTVSMKSLSIAYRAASEFIKVTTPSSLKNEAQPDRTHRTQTLHTINLGATYGTWFHETMQRISWQNLDTIDKTALLKDCPNVPRGTMELDLLLNSPLSITLQSYITASEVPILCNFDSNLAIEGFIDLLAYNPSNNSWLVVDWKTDSLSLEALCTTYAPQIQAYIQTISKTKQTTVVKGLIYSTRTGNFIEISPEN